MTAELLDDVELAAVPDLPTVELCGRAFHVRPQGVSLLSLMKFATLARKGLRTEDVEGLIALYDLLRQCVHADEWDAFEAHADEQGAGGEELMVVVRDAVSLMSARPTQPLSDSPRGRSRTGTSSAAGSSSRAWSTPQGSIEVQRAVERRGRADIGLVVKRAREASTGTSPS